MRKRCYRARVWLNEKEYGRYRKLLEETGLASETLLRSLIMGYEPKPKPPVDYYAMMNELHAIGLSLGRIVAKAGALKDTDAMEYRRNVESLHTALIDIQTAVELPERRSGP